MKKAFSKNQNKTKNKNILKLNKMKKTCLIMMLFFISLFSISPLNVRHCLSYIIKDEGSKGFQKSLTNGKTKLLTHLSCRFSTYNSDI